MVNGGEIWHMFPMGLAASVFAPNFEQAIDDEKYGSGDGRFEIAGIVLFPACLARRRPQELNVAARSYPDPSINMDM